MFIISASAKQMNIISVGHEFHITTTDIDWEISEKIRHEQEYPLISPELALKSLNDEEKEEFFQANRLTALEQIVIGNKKIMKGLGAWYICNSNNFVSNIVIRSDDIPNPRFIGLPNGVLILSHVKSYVFDESALSSGYLRSRIEEILRDSKGEVIAVRYTNQERKFIWFDNIHYEYENCSLFIIDNWVYEPFKIRKSYRGDIFQYLIFRRVYGYFTYEFIAIINKTNNIQQFIENYAFNDKISASS